MKLKHSKFQLVKLPQGMDLTLFLIREELKSQKFFNGLHKAGLDDCYYQPHLDKLILASVGLDDGTDETYDLYFRIMEKRSKKIEPDNDSVMKQAFKVYVELMKEKEKREFQS